MAVHTPIPARERRIPAWATWLTVLAFLVGSVYLFTNLEGESPPIGGGSPSPGASPGVDPAEALALMQAVTPQCQSCHGENLEGNATFPGLRDVSDAPLSENLQQLAQEHPDDWVALWIDGTDPAVQGIDRRGMPAFGDQLSPEEIETIAEYLKSL